MMDGPTMAALRLQAIAMAHLWFVTGREYEVSENGATWFKVYAKDLGLREDVLRGKCIRVRIDFEDATLPTTPPPKEPTA